MEKESLGQDSLQVGLFRFCPVYVIPLILHSIFSYTFFIPEGQTGEFWEHPESLALPEIREHSREKYSCFFQLVSGNMPVIRTDTPTSKVAD